MPILPSIISSLLTQVHNCAEIIRARLEGRRRLAVAAVGACVIILFIIIGVSLSGGNRLPQRETASGQAPIPRVVIPSDELFLPDEPDFLPGILLSREQRTIWTEEDAEPFWQDPLTGGEQEWRDRIEQTIHEIMESVP